MRERWGPAGFPLRGRERDGVCVLRGVPGKWPGIVATVRCGCRNTCSHACLLACDSCNASHTNVDWNNLPCRPAACSPTRGKLQQRGYAVMRQQKTLQQCPGDAMGGPRLAPAAKYAPTPSLLTPPLHPPPRLQQVHTSKAAVAILVNYGPTWCRTAVVLANCGFLGRFVNWVCEALQAVGQHPQVGFGHTSWCFACLTCCCCAFYPLVSTSC